MSMGTNTSMFKSPGGYCSGLFKLLGSWFGTSLGTIEVTIVYQTQNPHLLSFTAPPFNAASSPTSYQQVPQAANGKILVPESTQTAAAVLEPARVGF